VFEQARASRCGMETRVLVLRVLRDRSTSLVVQVLHSNAVLKCEVAKNSTKLEAGKFVTIRVHALELPIMRVSILADDSAETRMHSPRMHSECHRHTDSEEQLLRTTTPPRKRMCFQ
jgi:hypothetical protein